MTDNLPFQSTLLHFAQSNYVKASQDSWKSSKQHFLGLKGYRKWSEKRDMYPKNDILETALEFAAAWRDELGKLTKVRVLNMMENLLAGFDC